MQHRKDGKQKKLTFNVSKAETTPSTSGQATLTSLTTTTDGALQAEVLWLAKMACNNFSLCSSENIGNLFQTMFPDSKVAQDFSMSCTKASYTIGEGLGPQHKASLVFGEV